MFLFIVLQPKRMTKCVGEALFLFDPCNGRNGKCHFPHRLISGIKKIGQIS